MTTEEIRELIQLVLSTGVGELEVQRGENRVWIKRAVNPLNQEMVVTAAAAPAVPASAPPAPATATSPAVPAGEADLTDPSLLPVKSPIVGTFYEASAPGTPPFVKVGDIISTNTVMCIIESMKLMNEIEADVSGTLVKRLVENGQPVEYGETLFLVKPN